MLGCKPCCNRILSRATFLCSRIVAIRGFGYWSGTARGCGCVPSVWKKAPSAGPLGKVRAAVCVRSEEHTSELQSQFHLVCRLLLEKKKKKKKHHSFRKKKKKIIMKQK